jgi:polyhydroxyalkanoate synthesis regulator protein
MFCDRVGWGDAPMADQPDSSLIVVKRYADNRLYDTVGRHYVTVDDLRKWADGGIPLVVLDAETGRDVTSQLIGVYDA